MKPIQLVALMAVLIQSLSVADAGAREGKNAGGVFTAIAGDPANDNTSPVKLDRLDARINAIVPADAAIERVATGFTRKPELPRRAINCNS